MGERKDSFTFINILKQKVHLNLKMNPSIFNTIKGAYDLSEYVEEKLKLTSISSSQKRHATNKLIIDFRGAIRLVCIAEEHKKDKKNYADGQDETQANTLYPKTSFQVDKVNIESTESESYEEIQMEMRSHAQVKMVRESYAIAILHLQGVLVSSDFYNCHRCNVSVLLWYAHISNKRDEETVTNGIKISGYRKKILLLTSTHGF